MIASLRLKRAHWRRGSAFAPPPGVTPYHSVGAIGSNATFVPAGTFATSHSRVCVRVSSRPSTSALRIVVNVDGTSASATSAPNSARARDQRAARRPRGSPARGTAAASSARRSGSGCPCRASRGRPRRRARAPRAGGLSPAARSRRPPRAARARARAPTCWSQVVPPAVALRLAEQRGSARELALAVEVVGERGPVGEQVRVRDDHRRPARPGRPARGPSRAALKLSAGERAPPPRARSRSRRRSTSATPRGRRTRRPRAARACCRCAARSPTPTARARTAARPARR